MRRVFVIPATIIFSALSAYTQVSATPAQPSDQKKADTATIEGRVVRATDGSPLKKAQVMAISQSIRGSAGGDTGSRSGTTDADGKFLLRDLRPGRYSLIATRSGYGRQTYGQRSPTGPGTPITLVAGQNVKDIFFRMVPGGVIAGRVVDEDGEPVYRAQVVVKRWVFYEGKRQLMPSGMAASTNDLGEYRIAELAPGRYVVSVTQTLQYMYTAAPSDTREGYSETFYPGVFVSSQAVPIEVKGGEEVNGIHLRLVPMHAVHVRGVVRGGEKSLALNVQLLSKVAKFRGPEKFAMTDEKGAFDISGVLPGKYTVMAVSWGGDEDSSLAATQAIEVGESDVEGLTLALKRGADIPGRIRFEGNIDPKDYRSARVILSSDQPFAGGFGRPSTIEDNLTFVLKNFHDGDYKLNVLGLPENAYIKSATAGSQDVLEDGFHLAGQTKLLEIVISTNGGRVEGTVTDAKSNSVTGARVVLVPEQSRRSRQDLFRAGSTDQYGRFTLRGVPPGTYTIYAWETVEEGAYQDPDFLKQFEDAGKTVRISESGQVSVDLKVIPGQPAEGN